MDNSLDREKFIFGSLFLLTNKLQVKGDQLFEEDGMTLRQWFLTVMILQFQDGTPTLGEVSALMGTSHQNTKQLAKKLEEKNFLRFIKDQRDGRILRLMLTEQSHQYWKLRENEGDIFLNKLFCDLTNEELKMMVSGITKMLGTIETWDDEKKGENEHEQN
ncbi:hypothetical protein BKP37_08960 [Anaerobacillus alkalilacustris]|uniref:HTH marR-type domain-containing protein n=1 Tax=Anaerobacillus alkalilacustris TaxID=393763 RepID=A0A1S2LQ01_9BACI|nr:MarR family transcriptional regulator [Anaerobacillus alkalilacustris]OIJ14203.1 hypothetical protein BKP37_08960 [Anaerobacillus alkalilacustris]